MKSNRGLIQVLFLMFLSFSLMANLFGCGSGNDNGNSGSSGTSGGGTSGTGSWTATSTTGAPSARDVHTAVWTGSEMIVWGGYSIGLVNSGGRYNPLTNTWTATTTTGAPSGRFYYTAVWTGSQMIVWGGWDGINFFNTGSRYSP